MNRSEMVHLQISLQKCQRGIKTRAPGIGKCPDCKGFFIKDDSPIGYCPTCRPAHTVRCRDCRTPFDGTEEGLTKCPSCREQIALF
jgi:Zn finger protein HypA/HybF involved in hydrogenase expression